VNLLNLFFDRRNTDQVRELEFNISEISAGGELCKGGEERVEGKMGINTERFDMDLLLYSEN
jgi:hypothetical protein